MIRIVALLLGSAGTLVAQAAFAVTGSAGLARYAHAQGVDTTTAHGGVARLTMTVGIGPLALQVGYADAALGSGRYAAEGLVAVDVSVHRRVAIGAGFAAFADLPAELAARRWWAVGLRGTAILPLPHTPLTASVVAGAAPLGGVNRPDAFTSAVELRTALGWRPAGSRLTVTLAYDLRVARGGGARDAFETVVLSVGVPITGEMRHTP